MSFAAGLIGTGGPPYYGPECNAYLMKVVSGSLPPGLQLGEPICEWVISGTPTLAGTYSFTVQIAPQPNNLGQSVGPDGTQQFSITIGTATSDRVVLTGAVWSRVNRTLQIRGFDANNSATYAVYVTATGAELGTITERTIYNGGDGSFLRSFRENVDLNSLTIRDSLGGSATIPVTVNSKY
jgi:type 1 fimbria pilin